MHEAKGQCEGRGEWKGMHDVRKVQCGLGNM